MKKPKAKSAKRKARSAPPSVSAFTEPPPDMDVNDPRWPKAFSEWAARKAASYGMDPMEGMARMLGLNKEADAWKKRQERNRSIEEHSGDIYGTPNDQAGDGAVRSMKCSAARQKRHTKCDHGMYKDMCDICKPAPNELVDKMNKAEDCILYLRIQRLITEGEVDRIRRKINQRLMAASQSAKPQNDKLTDSRRP